MHLKYEDYAKLFEKAFMEKAMLSREEIEYFSQIVNNTSIADYVWLPLKFEGDMVYIDWYDEWRIEDFD